MKASKKPLVSVIMGVHNGMPYLKEAVESILKQTYKNFELIIVEDASTDKTWEYLNKLRGKKIKLLRNKKNLGLARSLNKALSFAKGEYIARMDADDISLPSRLTEQLKFMMNNKNIDICGTWAAIVNEDGKRVAKAHYPKKDKEIKQVLKWTTPLIHPTWVVNRKVFHELNGYKEYWDFVEDYEFLLRAKKYQMANIPKELLFWRSQSSRRSEKDIHEMYVKSLRLKWKYFRKEKLGMTYVPYLLRSFVATYFFPVKLKIYINKMSYTV